MRKAQNVKQHGVPKPLNPPQVRAVGNPAPADYNCGCTELHYHWKRKGLGGVCGGRGVQNVFPLVRAAVFVIGKGSLFIDFSLLVFVGFPDVTDVRRW